MTTVHVRDLQFKRDCFLKPPFKHDKGFKIVKVQTSATSRQPLLVQFSNDGGTIPPSFGVSTNDHGKTYLSFPVPCDKEYEAILAFQKDAIVYAKAHRKEWWSYDISDSQIEDNFMPIVGARKAKEKSEGEFWPANMKAVIPMNGDGDATCTVKHVAKDAFTVHDLPGCKWRRIMVEFSSVYFQNRYNWGFGPKTLRVVEVEDPESVAAMSAENTDYGALLLDTAEVAKPMVVDPDVPKKRKIEAEEEVPALEPAPTKKRKKV